MAQTVVGKKKYWQVGFDMRSLDLIKLMSGLVEIQGIEYGHGALWFYLRSNDKTGTLFTKGKLRGTRVAGFPPPDRSRLLVRDLRFSPTRDLANVC